MKDVNQVVDNTLDSLNKARTARPVAGASRKGNNPTESPLRIMLWEELAAAPSTTASGRM